LAITFDQEQRDAVNEGGVTLPVGESVTLVLGLADAHILVVAAFTGKGGYIHGVVVVLSGTPVWIDGVWMAGDCC
jgi:hypothetical protein